MAIGTSSRGARRNVQDWINLICGVLLFISPWALGFPGISWRQEPHGLAASCSSSWRSRPWCSSPNGRSGSTLIVGCGRGFAVGAGIRHACTPRWGLRCAWNHCCVASVIWDCGPSIIPRHARQCVLAVGRIAWQGERSAALR